MFGFNLMRTRTAVFIAPASALWTQVCPEANQKPNFILIFAGAEKSKSKAKENL